MRVSFVAEVPAAAPLVVVCKRGTRALYAVLLVCVVLEVVLAGAAAALAVGHDLPFLLVIVPLILFQLYFMVLSVREYQALLGPQLAADRTGVWVRTGRGSRPEAVFLPWPAIDGIDTHKGPVVRVMSREGEQLFGGRAHWRVRSLRRRFGTAFIVDGKRSATRAEQVAAELHRMAGVVR